MVIDCQILPSTSSLLTYWCNPLTVNMIDFTWMFGFSFSGGESYISILSRERHQLENDKTTPSPIGESTKFILSIKNHYTLDHFWFINVCVCTSQMDSETSCWATSRRTCWLCCVVTPLSSFFTRNCNQVIKLISNPHFALTYSILVFKLLSCGVVVYAREVLTENCAITLLISKQMNRNSFFSKGTLIILMIVCLVLCQWVFSSPLQAVVPFFTLHSLTHSLSLSHFFVLTITILFIKKERDCLCVGLFVWNAMDLFYRWSHMSSMGHWNTTRNVSVSVEEPCCCYLLARSHPHPSNIILLFTTLSLTLSTNSSFFQSNKTKSHCV
jgi:hypothetical protein